MNILGLKSNSDSFKKVRIPKSKEKYFPLLEITMDYTNHEFTAKMILEDDSSNEDWVVLNDPHFPVNKAFRPTSLLNDFLKSISRSK